MTFLTLTLLVALQAPPADTPPADAPPANAPPATTTTPIAPTSRDAPPPTPIAPASRDETVAAPPAATGAADTPAANPASDGTFVPTEAVNSADAELDAPLDMDLPAPAAAPVEPEVEKAPEPEPETRAADKLPPKTKARLLAMDLVNQGIEPNILAGLSLAMQEQARQSYPGETMTLEQVRLALSAAEQQQALGCEQNECMMALGDSIAADVVVGGHVAKVGNDYLITVLAVKSGTGEAIGSEQQKVPTHEDLSYYAVRRLTELALTGTSTDPRVPVRITASDAAGLIVDGRNEGSLPQTLALDPGQHKIEIEGDGYVPWRGTITVKEGEPQDIKADLTARGFPIWPFGMLLGGVGAVFGAMWVGVALYTFEAYNGGFGLLSLIGLQAKNTDYWHVQPADSATLSQKRSQVRLLGIGADFLAGAAIVFTVLALAVHVTDVVLISLE